MTRAVSVVTIGLLSGALAAPALADNPPSKQRGQGIGAVKPDKLAAAQRAEETAAAAASAGGQTGGAAAKMVSSITVTKTYEGGKLVGTTVTWTCTGDTAIDVNACHKGADTGGSAGCTKTSTGAKCVQVH